MAFTSLAAVFAGSVETAVIIGAVGEVGLTMSVVGAVTGNKDMMKIGGYMGLASGVGSLANSAFGAATTSAAEVAAPSGMSTVDQAAATAAGTAPSASASDLFPQGMSSAADLSSADLGASGLGAPDVSGLESLNTGAVDVNGYTSTAGDSAEQIAADKVTDPYSFDETTNTGASSGSSAAGNSATGSAGQSGAASSAPGQTTSTVQPIGPGGSTNGLAPAPGTTPGVNQATGLTPPPGMTGTPPPPNPGTDTRNWTKKLLDYLGTDKGTDTGLKLGSAALSGLGTGYMESRNYELKKAEFGLKQQQQANSNDQVKIAGIINRARGQ